MNVSGERAEHESLKRQLAWLLADRAHANETFNELLSIWGRSGSTNLPTPVATRGDLVSVGAWCRARLGWAYWSQFSRRFFNRRIHDRCLAAERGFDSGELVYADTSRPLYLNFTSGCRRVVSLRAFRDAGSTFDIFATPLSTDSAQVLTLALSLDNVTDACVAVTAWSTGAASPRQARSVFQLRSGRSEQLACGVHFGGICHFVLRQLRGEACILKLEIHAGDTAASHPDAPSATEFAFGQASPDGSIKHTLWKAQQLSAVAPLSEAIEFAAATASKSEHAAVALLRAGAVIHDDGLWLNCINEYISQFTISPLLLSPAGATKFQRLATAPLEPVTRGPLVSVVMPAFNAADTIKTAIESVLLQTWRPVELIVVDDCSNDETATLVEDIRRRDPRVILIRNPVNVGPYVCKNIALQIANGRFVTVQDADDWAHPQRLEKQLDVMLAAADTCVATLASMVRMRPDGSFQGMTKIGRTSSDGALRDAPTSCMLATDYMKGTLGYWDSVRFGADGEMIERLESVAGAGFIRMPILTQIYLDRPESLTRDPETGISGPTGVSEVRREYRDAWRRWHRTNNRLNLFIDFPQLRRAFPAPAQIHVDDALVQSVLAAQRRA